MTQSDLPLFTRERAVRIATATGDVWLVNRMDAIAAANAGTHERVDGLEATRLVRNANPLHLSAVVGELARIRSSSGARGDSPMFEIAERKLADGDLVVVRQARGGIKPAASADPGSLAVARIQHRLRGGPLVVHGVRYRVVTAYELGRLRDRDDFQIVRKVEAMMILERAAELPAFATLRDALKAAHAELADDWRPPQQPRGTILLRQRSVVARHTGTDREPAITPASLKKIRDEGWIEIEFVDAGMEPVSDTTFEIVLPDGDTKTASTGKSGVARLEGVKPGECRVRFPKVKGPVVLV